MFTTILLWRKFGGLALVISLLLVTGMVSAQAATTAADEILFVQLSDTHWGFNNPKINPDFAGTLQKAVAEVNDLQGKPDFLIFTGDETHITTDSQIRRQRMTEFKSITASLNIKTVKYLPGEHDASVDGGQAYQEFFGPLHYTFDLKGVHFIALDNVTIPDGLGDAQLTWLAETLRAFKKDAPIVLFAHRPLIDVYPPWDWKTKDGAKALELLKPFTKVSLFYGHIHQLRVDTADNVTQYAAQGLMFPLPAPGSRDTPSQVPWNPDHPYQGLGFRTVRINLKTQEITVKEYPILAQPPKGES
jgi:3',5'-cyclic AMP phosphodiesterase CpdA